MVLHVAVVEGNAVHHKPPVLHCPAIDRKGGAKDGVMCLHKIHQGVCHWPDIACGGGIKGGAIFKINLFHSLADQEPGRRKAVGHGPGRFLGPGFQCDYHGLGLFLLSACFIVLCLYIRNAVIKPYTHPSLYQERSRIADSGKIIGNAS